LSPARCWEIGEFGDGVRAVVCVCPYLRSSSGEMEHVALVGLLIALLLVVLILRKLLGSP